MTTFQVGDVVRLVSVNWLEEDEPAEFVEILNGLIGQSGEVLSVGPESRTALVMLGTSWPTLCAYDEIELVHRPAPKEQLPLLEVES